MYEKNLAIYDQLIALCPGIKRKGKTMPYTSDNGYMFTLLNKDAQIGIRLSKDDGEAFMEKYNTGRYKSHGAFLKGYVLIPEELHSDLDLLATYVIKGHEFVMTLPPK